MNFKNDFLTALQAGEDYEALMDLVRHYCMQGLSMEAAYAALHEIWLEYGFDTEGADEETMRDTLETVMEKVGNGQVVP